MKAVAGGVLAVALMAVGLWLRIRYRRRLRAGMDSLSGRVVVITGASSGLGEACAHAFYSVGCRLILCARRVEELQRVKRDLEKRQQKSGVPTHEVKIVTFDLADLSGVAAAMQRVTDCYGRVDVIINNGGISHHGSIVDTMLDVDVSIMNVNYFGTVAVTKALLPGMLERRSGHIVAISSIQGKIALPYRSAYSASKHAVQSFCDSLRAEVVHAGICVTVISPGYIRTSISLNALTPSGTAYGKMDENTSSGMSAEYAAKRVLEAVATRQNELLVGPFHHRLAAYLRNILPDVFFHIMAKRASKQAATVVEDDRKKS